MRRLRHELTELFAIRDADGHILNVLGQPTMNLDAAAVLMSRLLTQKLADFRRDFPTFPVPAEATTPYCTYRVVQSSVDSTTQGQRTNTITVEVLIFVEGQTQDDFRVLDNRREQVMKALSFALSPISMQINEDYDPQAKRMFARLLVIFKGELERHPDPEEHIVTATLRWGADRVQWDGGDVLL